MPSKVLGAQDGKERATAGARAILFYFSYLGFPGQPCLTHSPAYHDSWPTGSVGVHFGVKIIIGYLRQ